MTPPRTEAVTQEQLLTRKRWEDSRIAQQLGITPAQLRRGRYLANTGRTADLEAEGLAHLFRSKP